MQIVTTRRATPEFFRAHRKHITASDMPQCIAKRGSKKYNALVDRLVIDFEGIDDHRDDELSPWQIAHEYALAKATALYRRRTQRDVETTGFVVHDEFSWLGAAPHALVGRSALLYVRERKSLRSFAEKANEPFTTGELARIHCAMFVCDRQRTDVVDFVDMCEIVPDRISIRTVRFDHRWFSDHVLNHVTMVWRDVADRLRSRKSV